MTQPREDDTTSTPPHGDVLREHPDADGASASRHGVQLDPRGEPASIAPTPDSAVPSTPRSAPQRGETP